MRKVLLSCISCILSISAFSQVDSLHVNSNVAIVKIQNLNALEFYSDEEDEGDQPSFQALNALLSFNFSGNNKGLSNLTPIVNYGWIEKWRLKDRSKIALEIQPYAGGQINMRDSSSYIPGLMLPGVAGIKVDLSYRYDNPDGFSFMVAPVNFGYKLISNFADTTVTVAQHNIRTIGAIQFKDKFTFSIQYTYGWHNSISESSSAFRSIFSKESTDIQYLNLNLQTMLTNITSKMPTYLFIEWRGLLNSDKYNSFQNTRIISLGLRSEMGFKFSSSAKKGVNSFML
ncbi:hypothetical protein D3C71_26930 [compost metagenome]